MSNFRKENLRINHIYGKEQAITWKEGRCISWNGYVCYAGWNENDQISFCVQKRNGIFESQLGSVQGLKLVKKAL